MTEGSCEAFPKSMVKEIEASSENLELVDFLSKVSLTLLSENWVRFLKSTFLL